jgi:hypothetical protein
VALEDAHQVAEDFVVPRSTRRSVREFLEIFDFAPLAECLDLEFLNEDRSVTIIRGRGAASDSDVLIVYGDQYRPRLEFLLDPQAVFAYRSGMEYPAAGLYILRAWTGREKLQGVKRGSNDLPIVVSPQLTRHAAN